MKAVDRVRKVEYGGRKREWSKRSRYRLLLKRLAIFSGLLTIIYGTLVMLELWRHPSPAIDYVDLINQPIRKFPSENCAWPLYRQLLIEYDLENLDTAPLYDRRHPGKQDWEEGCNLLRQNAKLLDEIRRATLKPSMGFQAGFPWELHGEDSQVFFDDNHQENLPPSREDQLRRHLLCYCIVSPRSKLWKMGELLCADMALSAEQMKGFRFVENFRSLLGLAFHLREPLFLNNQMGATAAMTSAHCELALALKNHSAAFDVAHLRELADLVGSSIALMSLNFERHSMVFLDMAQRVYGPGDGESNRITLDGIKLLFQENGTVENGLRHFFGFGSPLFGQRYQNFTLGILAPVITRVVAPRGELLSKFNHWMALEQAEADSPLWHTLHNESEAEKALDEIKNHSRMQRYLPIQVFDYPKLRGDFRYPVTVSMRRMFNEALTVVIALELHRHEHGSYPAILEELSPRYLPEIPLDASTGKPLLYRIEEGRPVIYGRGINGVDDGGRATPEDARAWPRSHWNKRDSADWIFFPPPSRPPDDE